MSYGLEIWSSTMKKLSIIQNTTPQLILGALISSPISTSEIKLGLHSLDPLINWFNHSKETGQTTYFVRCFFEWIPTYITKNNRSPFKQRKLLFRHPSPNRQLSTWSYIGTDVPYPFSITSNQHHQIGYTCSTSTAIHFSDSGTISQPWNFFDCGSINVTAHAARTGRFFREAHTCAN